MTEASVQLVSVSLDWSGTESAHAEHVNQVLAQVGPPGPDGMPDGIYVTMGSVPPPALIEGDPSQARLLEKIRTSGVTVNVLGQFHMSRAMLSDMIRVFQTTVDKYDEAVGLASAATREDEG